MSERAVHMSGMDYRPDIDGLRAVAVLGVVAFHLELIGGGFAGVDIFFVISGYLITRILVTELAAGTFNVRSLIRFYERRIRRIIPALLAMAIVTTALSYLFLFPSELTAYGRSLQSLALFISNYNFQGETGYFDGAAEEKPLLHTWSLAVEEQYYLAFPLLLWLVWRWKGQRAALGVIAVVGIASAAYSEVLVRSSQDAAFFSTPARIWELLTGAILVLLHSRLPSQRFVRESLTAAGACLIAWTYLAYSPDTEFPGASAMIPVFGSALLIAGGAKGPTLISQALTARPLVWIGLISYSVYLWHWPMIVFAKYRYGPLLEQYAAVATVTLFASSLLAGYLSWRFIEQPFRKTNPRQRWQGVFAIQAAATALILTGGALLSNSGGIPNRWPREVLAVLNPASEAPARPLPACQSDPAFKYFTVCNSDVRQKAGAQGVLLWGDSHAAMLQSAVAQAVPKDQIFYSVFSPGCPPLLGVTLTNRRSRSESCRQQNAEIRDYVAKNRPRISTVVLAARWAYYVQGTPMPYETARKVMLGDGDAEASPTALRSMLTDTVQSILQHADRVIILAPIPEFDRSVPVAMARALAWNQPYNPAKPRETVIKRQERTLKVLKQIGLLDPQRITIASPLPYFCDEQICRPADDLSRPLFKDNNHLNWLGIERVQQLLDTLLRQPHGAQAGRAEN